MLSLNKGVNFLKSDRLGLSICFYCLKKAKNKLQEGVENRKIKADGKTMVCQNSPRGNINSASLIGGINSFVGVMRCRSMQLS